MESPGGIANSESRSRDQQSRDNHQPSPALDPPLTRARHSQQSKMYQGCLTFHCSYFFFLLHFFELLFRIYRSADRRVYRPIRGPVMWLMVYFKVNTRIWYSLHRLVLGLREVAAGTLGVWTERPPRCKRGEER